MHKCPFKSRTHANNHHLITLIHRYPPAAKNKLRDMYHSLADKKNASGST
jgi:hypothetical protein